MIDPAAVCAVTTASTAVAITDTATSTGEMAEIEDDGAAEVEARTTSVAPGTPLVRYTLDLSDVALIEAWKTKPEGLGTISVGFADEGRLINSRQFPCDGGDVWTVVQPPTTWGTTETIDAVVAAAQRVKSIYPGALPLRVNSISAQDGGHLRPHRSHQNGRDVDLGFYYPTATPVGGRARETIMDLGPNWELVKSLFMTGDVQVVLVDRRVQKVLYAFALARGEDKGWLDSLFLATRNAPIQHARGHRDHFHVRYFNPRAQELGRRIAPLLAMRPEHNLITHRVRNGDTLGALAVKYNSGVKAIQKASRMKSTFLRLGQVLHIPIHGPCTQCPVPPPFELPPRRIPPPIKLAEVPPAVTATVSAIGVPSSPLSALP